MDESMRHARPLVLLLAVAALAVTAAAASFTIVLDKSVYEYGDTIQVRVNGTLPCDIATLRIVSPLGEPVKVMLVTADEASKGISIAIPSLPTGGWVAGSYRVELVCGVASASASLAIKSSSLFCFSASKSAILFFFSSSF